MIAGATLVVTAYLVGAIPFGLLVGRMEKGIDIRRHGSGNIGTSNVLRTLGKRAAFLTLAGDLLKGYLPLLAGILLGISEPWLAAAGVCAVIGHSWSPYIGFRGGKGVATSFGAALAFMPGIAGLTLLVYLSIAGLTRYTSLAALIGSASMLLWAHVLKASQARVLFAAACTILIYVRHRENVQRLINGNERKIGQRVEV